ncbi:imidazole glycerol phosphate synthase subunit HisF [Candidatus Vidania fulgoroideorum]
MIKRIIACLDVKNNKVVKGRKFLIYKSYDNPLFLSEKYSYEGVDEIIYLNINKEKIVNICKNIKDISKKINIPLIVGGNIKNISEVNKLFNNGADRISLNSTLLNKNIVKKISKKYGAQSIVASVDVKKKKKKWKVFINGGKDNTGIDVRDWCNFNEKKGIGEFLLTSIDRDGLKKGYDYKLLYYISKNVTIPLIPSGGGGNLKDFKKSICIKGINSLLIASVLHDNKYKIKEIKKNLSSEFFVR